jgi:predicted RNA-binding Zn ribbon-like protein
MYRHIISRMSCSVAVAGNRSIARRHKIEAGRFEDDLLTLSQNI